MSDYLIRITSVLFLITLVGSSLIWIEVWEDKEYRLLKLWNYLKDTNRGKNLLTGKESLAKWLIIISYLATVFFTNLDSVYHLVVFLFYTAAFLALLGKILNREVRLPSYSLNNLAIFALVFLLEGLLFLFSPVDKFLWLLIIDKFLPFFIMLFILFLSVFFDFSSDVTINKAVSKITRHKNLLSIAIVGSYGRGSTKEFISRVLSQKFDVLKNDESYSSAVGIAKKVITDLSEKKQIFIAEMKDDREGDIAEMFAIIAPKISVICGIDEDKISSFGTIDKLLSSKREAVGFLPKDGIALFNDNNIYAQRLYKTTKRKKFTYFVGKGKSADALATNIKEKKMTLSFDVVIFNKKYHFENIKLVGRQNIEYVLPAIFIGIYTGIDMSLIKKILGQIRPLPAAMEPLKGAGGEIFINDTHNVNVNSVINAVSYMQLYKGIKILVLEPLVGLGRNSDLKHIELGKLIGKNCDVLLLTNNNHFNSILKGIKKAGTNCQVQVLTPSGIARTINKRKTKDGVVVFEGRETRSALNALQTEHIY